MRKNLLCILLLCSLAMSANVPPRDPARRADWLREQAAEAATQRYKMPAATQATNARTLIPRVLVIMVNFSNFNLVSTKADVDSMFNGQNWTKDGATGSIRQYFYDQSMGAYNPQFDIVGPVTLSQPYSYYGTGTNRTYRAGYMVTEACTLVNDSVDFTLYDSNNDGKVDLVYIFYAGYGENDSPTFISSPENLLWPQYWNIESAGYGSNMHVFDGKAVYACEYSNELDGYYSTQTNPVIAGIGTACHEFGHALGLPDLYTTDESATHKVLGMWDVMCYGLYNNDMHTPPSFSAYERFFMGWMTPTLITRPDTLTLENIATSNQAFMICEKDTHNMNGVSPDTTVFYLVENKQWIGWDIAVPGHGMLLTRINYQSGKWQSNTVNNNPLSMGIDIIEADGKQPLYDKNNATNGYYGKPGDLFPAGASFYSDIPDHNITDIVETNGLVSFVYRGGIAPDAPNPTTALTDMPAEDCNTRKIVRNGQVLILHNGKLFTLFGIEVR